MANERIISAYSMEMGRWGDYKFAVSARLIRSFSGLTVKGQAETEDKSDAGQKYVSYKNGKPHEISMSVILHSALGVDAREEAMAFVSDAAAGKSDFLYIANKKLVPCKVMLTSAEVTDTAFTPKGQWISCKVKLTFKQCTNFDGVTPTKKPGGKKPPKPTSITTTIQQYLTTHKPTAESVGGLSDAELEDFQSALISIEEGHIAHESRPPAGGMTTGAKFVTILN